MTTIHRYYGQATMANGAFLVFLVRISASAYAADFVFNIVRTLFFLSMLTSLERKLRLIARPQFENHRLPQAFVSLFLFLLCCETNAYPNVTSNVRVSPPVKSRTTCQVIIVCLNFTVMNLMIAAILVQLDDVSAETVHSSSASLPPPAATTGAITKGSVGSAIEGAGRSEMGSGAGSSLQGSSNAMEESKGGVNGDGSNSLGQGAGKAAAAVMEEAAVVKEEEAEAVTAAAAAAVMEASHAALAEAAASAEAETAHLARREKRLKKQAPLVFWFQHVTCQEVKDTRAKLHRLLRSKHVKYRQCSEPSRVHDTVQGILSWSLPFTGASWLSCFFVGWLVGWLVGWWFRLYRCWMRPTTPAPPSSAPSAAPSSIRRAPIWQALQLGSVRFVCKALFNVRKLLNL